MPVRRPMTLVEKVLARASDELEVVPGQIVRPVPDLVTFHDGYAELLTRQFEAVALERLADPDRVLISTDHNVSYENEIAATRGRMLRELARRYGIRQFYDCGRGGHGNVFPVERGIVGPGQFVFAADGNATNFGAVGCVVICLGSEILSALALGTSWVQVPETVRVRLVGQLREGTSPRDLSMWARTRLEAVLSDADHFDAVEIGGPGAEALSLDALVTLCNSVTSAGPATVVVEPTPERCERQSRAGGREFERVVSDDDARYREVVSLDLSTLEPQIAAPDGQGLRDLTTLLGHRIDQAVIGSCASGMYEDMLAAARVLAGGRIADHVRLIVTPATQDTYDRCLDEGLLKIFRDAGAMVTEPGCGPCAGGRAGALAGGETSIASINDNQQGRLGAMGAHIYLASPATVAASALAGEITDPRDVR
ncbi:aconitase family protein [Streptosporangium sp. NPDC006930]|uniref:3-isopropylmalate dehydratase large subunit n=1 Tax=unclassified Streptosporangium TaxID=2632669 RepID=UPI0034144FC2